MGQLLQPRLLVADDDLGVIAAYRIVLESSNEARHNSRSSALEAELFGEVAHANSSWHVTYVDQGEAAIAEIRSAVEAGNPFKAVFLDVRMPPGMDGYDAAEQIRKIDPDIHIVIISGFADYLYEDFLEVAGPKHLLTYLPKPVWPSELRSIAQAVASGEAIPAAFN